MNPAWDSMSSSMDWLRSHMKTAAPSVYGTNFGSTAQWNQSRPVFMGQPSGFPQGQFSSMRPSWRNGGGGGYAPYGQPHLSGGYFSSDPAAGSIYVVNSGQATSDGTNGTNGQTTQAQQSTVNGSSLSAGPASRVEIPLESDQRSATFPHVVNRSTAYSNWLKSHASNIASELADFEKNYLPDKAKLVSNALEHAVKSIESLEQEFRNSLYSVMEAEDQGSAAAAAMQRFCGNVLPKHRARIQSCENALSVASQIEEDRTFLSTMAARIQDELSRTMLEKPSKLNTQRALQLHRDFGSVYVGDTEDTDHLSPWDKLMAGVKDQYKISGGDREFTSTAGSCIPLYRMENPQSQAHNQTGYGTTAQSSAIATSSSALPGSATSRSNDPYANLARTMNDSGLQAMNLAPMSYGQPYQQQQFVYPGSPSFNIHHSSFASQQPSPYSYSSFIPHVPSFEEASTRSYHSQPQTQTQFSPYFNSQHQTMNSSVPTSGHQSHY
ncbi:hypothetical protein IAU59_001462 [Kwoniella sp. CBS 9459]